MAPWNGPNYLRSGVGVVVAAAVARGRSSSAWHLRHGTCHHQRTHTSCTFIVPAVSVSIWAALSLFSLFLLLEFHHNRYIKATVYFCISPYWFLKLLLQCTFICLSKILM